MKPVAFAACFVTHTTNRLVFLVIMNPAYYARLNIYAVKMF